MAFAEASELEPEGAVHFMPLGLGFLHLRHVSNRGTYLITNFYSITYLTTLFQL